MSLGLFQDVIFKMRLEMYLIFVWEEFGIK